jgi:hypothetical protein
MQSTADNTTHICMLTTYFFSKPVQVTRAQHSEQAHHHLHTGYVGDPKLTAPLERDIVLHGDYYLKKKVMQR